MADPDTRTRLEEIAREVRSFLEPHWMCWHELEGSLVGRLSRGVCDRSSLFLCRVMRAAGLPAHFVTGAPVKGAFGYQMDGVWQGHAWVECDGLVIDITADQFGGPRVRIIPVGDPRYSGGEDMVDVQIAQTREETVARLIKRWESGDQETDCGTMFADTGG